MKKALWLMLLAVAALAISAPHNLRAAPGDPCTTADGRSGYAVVAGESGEEVCQAS